MPRVFIRRLLRHGMAVLIGLALLIGPVSPSLNLSNLRTTPLFFA